MSASMPNYGKLIFSLLLIQLAIAGSVHILAQPPTFEEYVKPVSGRNVHLHINSLNRYKTGHELSNWTRVIIDIDISDLTDPGDTWTLYAYTEVNQLTGDYGNSLDVDYISVSAIGENPAGQSLIFQEVNPLTALEQPLANGTGPGYFVILINYTIGTEEGNRLLGEFPDYYFVDLFLRLRTD
jgi:hypothetical protein